MIIFNIVINIVSLYYNEGTIYSSEQENQAYSPRPNLVAKEGPNHSGIPLQGKQNIKLIEHVTLVNIAGTIMMVPYL